MVHTLAPMPLFCFEINISLKIEKEPRKLINTCFSGKILHFLGFQVIFQSFLVMSSATLAKHSPFYFHRNPFTQQHSGENLKSYLQAILQKYSTQVIFRPFLRAFWTLRSLPLLTHALIWHLHCILHFPFCIFHFPFCIRHYMCS